MEVTDQKIYEFSSLLVQRGLGLYGRDKMAGICYDADVALLDDDSISFLNNDHVGAMRKLMVSYAKFNLVARMTVMALAKQYDIELPPEIKKKKVRKSRFARLFRR